MTFSLKHPIGAQNMIWNTEHIELTLVVVAVSLIMDHGLKWLFF